MSCADENKKTGEGDLPPQKPQDDFPALAALEKQRKGVSLTDTEKQVLAWSSLRRTFG